MQYDFERCRLDTASREVALDGSEVHLSPKAFELLRFLIDARPRVVTKAELMQRLWPDSFVEEANLPVLVGEVRRAIGDSGDGHIIRTHHRIGYSFAAAVRESHSPSDRAPWGTRAPVIVVQGRRIVLAGGANLVGRDSGADVRIDHTSVSRRHARIIVDGTTATLEDLDSKNGTRVRGVPIAQRADLSHGDVLAFGAIDARFEFQDLDNTATDLVQGSGGSPPDFLD